MSRAARLRRSAQLAIHSGSIVQLLATMGHSPARRMELGRRIARVSSQLDGIYPWISYHLASWPSFGGPDITLGIQSSKDQAPFRPSSLAGLQVSGVQRDGPFFHLVTSNSLPPEQCYLIPTSPLFDLVATDVAMLESALRLLRPLVGPVSPTLVVSFGQLIESRINAEASLQSEQAERGRLPPGFGLESKPLALDSATSMTVDRAPLSLERASATARMSVIDILLRRWCNLVLQSGFLTSHVCWSSVSTEANSDALVLRRLAGSVTASPTLVELLASILDCRSSVSIESDSSIERFISSEFRIPPDATKEICHFLALLLYPEARGFPGPLSILRLFARSTSNASGPTIPPEAFVFLRQLVTFREMVNEFDTARGIFEFSNR